jgi:hypothetical protein
MRRRLKETTLPRGISSSAARARVGSRGAGRQYVGVERGGRVLRRKEGRGRVRTGVEQERRRWRYYASVHGGGVAWHRHIGRWRLHVTEDCATQTRGVF